MCQYTWVVHCVPTTCIDVTMTRFFLVLLPAFFVTACTVSTDDAATDVPETSWSPGSAWSLVWSDEFEGDELDAANWNRQVEPAGRFNEEWQRYTENEENAYVENGVLIVQANHVGDEHGLDQYTSARLNTAGNQAWTYGKIAARIKLPFGQGIWPAFWTLGANISENGGDTPWPASGEIDILEMYGTRSDGIVEANIHHSDSTGAHTMMGAVPYELEEGRRFADEFHIFEIEWNEKEIIWSVDGNVYASADISGPERTEFHKPHFLLLNIAVGGTWAGRPDETTVFPQKMFVDWVRVYQHNG